MIENKNARARWRSHTGKRRKDVDGLATSVPILRHYGRRYNRKFRIRLRLTPFSIMLAIGALYCMTPLLEKAIGCIGTIPSVGILAGIAVIVGITI